MSPKHGNCANYDVIGQKKRPRPNEAQGMPIRRSWPILLMLDQGAPIPSGSGDCGFHPDTADRVIKNCVICMYSSITVKLYNQCYQLLVCTPLLRPQGQAQL